MPRLRNRTPFMVALVPMINPEGRNVAVVLVKATYDLASSGVMQLAGEQEEIHYVDAMCEGKGKRGNEIQAIRVPADLADYKPHTDVVIVRPADENKARQMDGREISLRLGPLRKVCRVMRDDWPWGPLRRDEEPRRGFAGTYDRAWMTSRMPLLPADFDPRHHQVAPPDQIVTEHLAGDEELVVRNLHDKNAIWNGRLPGRAIVVSGNLPGHYFTRVAVLDTILLWSDTPRITLIWRHAIPTRQKIEEVCNVHVYECRVRTALELYGRS
jgi:hypothetical protein